ncbi:MAG: hypothetical protein WDZ94_05590 [Patescibacteria group bacterium]
MKKSKKTQVRQQTFRWNEVTPLSKYLAMALFITFPLVSFLLGMAFQQDITIAACTASW